MHCPECGKKVEDGALFCGECGAKIPKEESKPAKKKTVKKTPPKKKGVTRLGEGYSPKAKKIIIAQIIILIALIGAFFYLGTRSSKPEAAANQFVKDYNDKKWSKIYDAYDFDGGDNKFLTRDAFVKTMEQSDTDTLSGTVGGYFRDGEYVYRIKKGASSITVNVAKSAKKSFFFFDKYEVTGVSDSISLTQSVSLPNVSGVTMKIDGIEAENTSTDQYASSYQVVLFRGTHKLTFSGDDDMFEKDSYTFKTSDNDLVTKIRFSDSAREEAAKALKGYLPDITENYIKDGEKEDLESCFVSKLSADTYGHVLCGYNFYTGSDAKNLGDVEVSSCEPVDTGYYYRTEFTLANGIPVRVKGSRSYQAQSFSGSYTTQTCEIRGTAYLVKKDGKWVINSASSANY